MATMRKTASTSLPDVALDTFIKLMRASESVSSDVHRSLSAAGLSISQFGILEALYHRGNMSQKELAVKILKSAGNITMVINNLEKRGLAIRERCTEDKRACIISLTPGGETLIKQMFPAHAARIRKRMSALTAGEQKSLGELLKKLGRAPASNNDERSAGQPHGKKQREK